MSYSKIITYRVVPEEAFSIIRSCSGCGGKAIYHSTECFRVNANGNRLDVWLIYQCGKCKHTYNLPIYERIRPGDIPPQEYDRFLENDQMLAGKYGTARENFLRNKAEINWNNVRYRIEHADQKEKESILTEQNTLIVIENPFGFKLRMDKIAAGLLQLTRSKIKQMEQNGKIRFHKNDRNQYIEIN